MPGLLRRGAAGVRRLAVCARTDIRLTIELAGWRLCLPVLKRTLSVAVLARLMWSDAAAPNRPAPRIAHVRRIMLIGGRVLVSRNCLERSLVLYRLLSREGAKPSLVLGTTLENRTVIGHAWVEVNGVRIGDLEGRVYDRVVIFGPHGRTSAPSALGASAWPMANR